MPTTTQQLNISITPHFSRFIRSKIKSGRYANANEVVREALRRLEQEEAVVEQSVIIDPEDAHDSILQELASMERGDHIELRDQAELHSFFADIVARGKKRFAPGKSGLGGDSFAKNSLRGAVRFTTEPSVANLNYAAVLIGAG